MSHMLIDYYKAIEDSSAKMLEAAKLLPSPALPLPRTDAEALHVIAHFPAESVPSCWGDHI